MDNAMCILHVLTKGLGVVISSELWYKGGMSELATYDDPDAPTPEEAFERLEAMSRLTRSRIAVPKTHKFSRSDVVSAFASAFEMIGGTPRLALWANDNPTEFYRLFGKLLPSATQTEVMHRAANGDVRALTTEELLQQLAEAEGTNIINIDEYRDDE
jgi:hypothetical protein